MDLMRLRNILSSLDGMNDARNYQDSQVIGNDLPSQGGISGNIRIPRGTFGQEPLPQPSFPEPPQEEIPQPVFSSGVKSPRSYPVSERLFELLDSYPERTNPSIWRKIAAGASAFGSNYTPQMADEIVNQPYNQRMRDWAMRAKAFGDVAKIEGDINEQRSRDELNDSLIERRTFQNQRDLDRTEYERGLLSGAFKFEVDPATGKGYIITKDGKVKIVDREMTSELRMLELRTGLDIMKIDAQRAAALERIAATGEMRQGVARVVGEQQRQNIQARGNQGATQNDTQYAQMLRNRANIMDRRWPHLGRYLTLNPNTNMPEVEISSPWPWQDPIDEESIRKQISDWLEKGIEPPAQTTTPAAAPAPAAPNPQATRQVPAGPVTRPDNTGLPTGGPPVTPRGTPNSRNITAGRTETEWRQLAMASLKRQKIPINDRTLEEATRRLKEANSAPAAR